MGKSRSTPSTQTVEQTNLPEYAEPYFRRLLDRTEAQSLSQYTPYSGQRIAEFTPDMESAFDLTRQIAGQGIAGLPEATGVVAGNIQAGQQIAQEARNPFQFSDPGTYTAANAAQYMSPYMQNVVDEQSRRAIQRFNEQAGARNTAAVRAGAFGGSRQGVQEAIAERSLMEQLGGIQAQGLQQAFQQGAQQFGQDRQALMATERAQAAENAQARAAQLQALGFSAQQAQQMVGFGEAGRAADIQGAQLLENIGRTGMAQEQQALDTAYQDFVRQQAFPEQQLQFYSSILRGVPVEPGVTTTAYTPFNPFQQLLGAGLGAIGLYRGLQA